jgi:hypothetical protein
MTSRRKGIDPRGPRFGQTLTGSLALAAFVFDAPLVLAALAVVLGAGSVLGYRFNLWARLYEALVRPFLGEPAVREHPAPPRFAMCLGFVFVSAAAITLVSLGAYVPAWIGWTLALAVAGLALLAATTGICVGCEIYGRLVRRGASEREGVSG